MAVFTRTVRTVADWGMDGWRARVTFWSFALWLTLFLLLVQLVAYIRD